MDHGEVTSDPGAARGRRAAVLPWDGRPARADLAILGGIVVSTVVSLALIPVIPALLARHPLLLELISGSSVAAVTVGAHARLGEIRLPVAVAAGVPALMMFDWAYWWAGRRWGDRALTLLLGRGGQRGADKRAARLERMAGRFGPVAVVLAYFLPVPTALIYAGAGLAGMRLATFLILDVIGTALWVGMMVAIGYAWGQGAIDVVDRVDHYALWVTLGLVALVVIISSARRRR